LKGILERSSRFLDRPVGPVPRSLLVFSALLLLPVYLLPLWHVRVVLSPARQLALDVYAQHWIVEGPPPPPDAAEFEEVTPGEIAPQSAGPNWFPFALGALGLLALRAAVVGKIGSVLDVAVLGGYFVLFALWSFGGQAVNYGVNIFPGGELAITPIDGPLFGSQALGELLVDSRPGSGTYLMLGLLLLLVLAFLAAWREGKAAERADAAIVG
jgi:hypothetical protein